MKRGERKGDKRLQGIESSNDPAEVVSTAELFPILKLWCERYDAERPKKNGFAHSPNEIDNPVAMRVEVVHVISSKTWLEQETGVNQRQIYAIINCDSKFTSISVADRLLTAMGLHLSDVHVIPNPRWTQEQWQSYMEARGCG